MGPGVPCAPGGPTPRWGLTPQRAARGRGRPFRVDGLRIGPRVSVPIEKPTRPAAVAAPGPADDPDASCSVFHGLRVTPPNHCAVTASAPVESFATRIAPAFVSRL